MMKGEEKKVSEVAFKYTGGKIVTEGSSQDVVRDQLWAGAAWTHLPGQLRRITFTKCHYHYHCSPSMLYHVHITYLGHSLQSKISNASPSTVDIPSLSFRWLFDNFHLCSSIGCKIIAWWHELISSIETQVLSVLRPINFAVAWSRHSVWRTMSGI